MLGDAAGATPRGWWIAGDGNFAQAPDDSHVMRCEQCQEGQQPGAFRLRPLDRHRAA